MKEIIPPVTKQGEAVTYTLNEYQKLVRYMKHAFATADDNMAENTIRPFAIGRKNWLFCDSPSSTLSPAFIVVARNLQEETDTCQMGS